tara:strand:+ start:4620 stop:4904 length:285 start_codon:yes stop_codon:yes gene_type:complete
MRWYAVELRRERTNGGRYIYDSKPYVMTMELIGTILGAVGGLVATWVKMTNDVTKIKSRLFSLEKQETKVQVSLDNLLDGVNEIKLLLAAKGIK